MNRSARIAAIATLVLAGAAPAQTSSPPEPVGYRMDEYRTPTPATLSGARVVNTDEAHDLWKTKSAVFIDVLPRPPKPSNLPATTVWRDKPRRDIPGSLWLPDTGYGALAPSAEGYFTRGLAKASGGQKARALVFYCLTDCWMSWNAAKRAMAHGYTNVVWYPDGTDGWSAEGLDLEDREPESRD